MLKVLRNYMAEGAAEIARLRNRAERAEAAMENEAIVTRDLKAEIERLRAESAAVMDDYRACMGERDRLRSIVRVNGLRWGHTHAEIDAILILSREVA
jgi:hypothetical protein